MQSVISDANIIIDLAAGDLLPTMFLIPGVTFHVPDVLYVEELSEQYGYLPGLGLQVHQQPAAATEYVTQLRRQYRGPSTHDLFALALAHGMQCPLLTGDHALREAAGQERVEVRGTLWVVEQLLVAGLITVERAEAAYAAMRAQNSRLPWELVEDQLARWRQGAAGLAPQEAGQGVNPVP